MKTNISVICLFFLLMHVTEAARIGSNTLDVGKPNNIDDVNINMKSCRLRANETTNTCQFSNNFAPFQNIVGSAVSVIPLVLQPVVGTASDVANGDANFTSPSQAIASATVTGVMYFLGGLFEDDFTIDSNIIMVGTGKTILSGTIDFDADSDGSILQKVEFIGTINLNSGATSISVDILFLSATPILTEASPTESINNEIFFKEK